MSQPIVRGIISIIVVGLVIAQWWAEQKPNAVPRDHAPGNEPTVVARDNSSIPDDGQSTGQDSATDDVADPKLTSSPKAATSSRDLQQPRVDGLKVHDVAIKNLDGKIVYRGTIDLTQTIERIDAGRVLSEFRHDGSEFKNFERHLPNKPRGHYHEWVHPTKEIRGPGPQRVMTGKKGEMFYTWGHYDHFIKIRSPR